MKPRQLIGQEIILPTKVKVEDILDTPLMLVQIALTKSRQYGDGVRLLAHRWNVADEKVDDEKLVIATFAKGIVSVLADYLAQFETRKLDLKDGLLVQFTEDGETYVLAPTTE